MLVFVEVDVRFIILQYNNSHVYFKRFRINLHFFLLNSYHTDILIYFSIGPILNMFTLLKVF